MKIHPITLALIAATAVAGCRQNAAEQQQPEVSFAGFTDTIALQVEPLRQDEPEESYFEQQARKPAAAPAKKTATTQPKASKKAAEQPETIYVETDGAQGRVWGHVTMNGDRGTGTIHDWDENTWAVSVTRHGDELFAVDQNSRLYVFKLKQK